MEKTETKKRNGRPTKKTPQVVAQLLRAIATGAPYTICCSATGVHLDTFLHWKSTDPVFAAQVEKAAGETALRMLKRIEKHGEESFQPLAWILERRFPQQFSRPEVQFNIQQNNNTTNIHNELTITIQAAENIKQRTHDMEAEVAALFEARPTLSPPGAMP